MFHFTHSISYNRAACLLARHPDFNLLFAWVRVTDGEEAQSASEDRVSFARRLWTFALEAAIMSPRPF
jgi:hypothetical protein